jgi:hypothetical protein
MRRRVCGPEFRIFDHSPGANCAGNFQCGQAG